MFQNGAPGCILFHLWSMWLCRSEEVKFLYNKEPTCAKRESCHLEIKVATCGALDLSHRDESPKESQRNGVS